MRQGKVWAKRFVLLAIRLLFLMRKARSTRPFVAEETSSILLVETAFLGDVVAMTPLLKMVRQRFPEAQIDVLVERRNSPLLQFEERIDTLQAVNTSQFISLLQMVLALRRNAYDLVICVSPGVRNSLISLLAGRCWAVGYLVNYSWNTSFFNDFHAVMIGGKRTSLYPKEGHLTQRALNALAPLGLIDFPLPEETLPFLQLPLAVEREKAQELRKDGFIKPGKINMVVHPCASWRYKQWPLEKMALLLERLFQQYPEDLHVILIGLTRERVTLEAIEQKVSQPIKLLLGTDLLTVMTLIKQANIFLGNDSGPKHIADSFAKPLVELLGPGLAETVGGKNRQAQAVYAGVACSPCSQMECVNNGCCMQQISIETVFSHLCIRIDEQLAATSLKEKVN